MPIKVQVLMSTYNGEKYLKQQIDSILSQKDVEVHLLVRDDGSKDQTVDILKEYNNLEIVEGQNVGATNSFLDLIELSGDYDYYAFSDQDDVWDNDKLITGINAIKNYSTPALYSSNTRLVDSNLSNLKSVIINPKITLGSSLVKNCLAGCTMVMNKQLLSLLKIYKPHGVPYHDWWVNVLVLSVGGISRFDKQPHISYRQHGNNVVGASNSQINRWKKRLEKFLYTSYRRDDFAAQILKNYGGKLNKNNKLVLELMANYKEHPIRLIKSGYFKTDSIVDNILFDLCIILKKG